MGSTTVVLVPRESFSTVRRGVRSAAASLPRGTRVVLVDGGSPRSVHRRLLQAAEANDYLLLRSERLLSPNRARNLALPFVDTEFVLFLDYETEMPPGTVERLEQCARDTDAAVVGPVYLEGAVGTTTQVHMAGGECHLVGPEGARRFVDEHLGHQQPDFSAREPIRTEQVEFHCLMVRTEVLERLGGLDEELLSMREHNDLCLTVREQGGEVWCEPRAAVHYSRPRLPTLADAEYGVVRWSDTWNRRSLDRFNEKWSIADDDPATDHGVAWGRNHRRYTYRPYLSLVSRCCGPKRHAFYDWFDDRAQRWVERRHPLESTVAADARVAHAATWTSALASRA